MKEFKVQESGRKGRLILIYGEGGVGKSTSCLQSLPDPILAVITEPRDPTIALEAVGHSVKVKFMQPESYEDLIEFLSKQVERDSYPYKSLVTDSFSYYMNVELKTLMEKETSEAGIFPGKRTFIDQFRLDLTAFGSLAGGMKRLCGLLGKISQEGIIVVATALLQNEPKWNRDLSATPAFIGKDFPTNAPGYFDLIGLVQQRLDENGNVVYPPLVSFEGDGSFVCKWTGRRIKKAEGPLDFKRILGLMEK